MPNTASVSVLPEMCAMPQSSRIMLTSRACCSQRWSSWFWAEACGTNANATATAKPRMSFFIKDPRSSLPFAQAVTQSIRRDDKKDFIRSFSVLVYPEVRCFLSQSIRLQFSERCFGVIHFKEAAFLSRVASVFSQANLNLVSSQDGGLMRGIIPRHNPESHHRFVKRNCGVDACDRKIHFVFGIRMSGFEYCVHSWPPLLIVPRQLFAPQ